MPNDKFMKAQEQTLAEPVESPSLDINEKVSFRDGRDGPDLGSDEESGLHDQAIPSLFFYSWYISWMPQNRHRLYFWEVFYKLCKKGFSENRRTIRTMLLVPLFSNFTYWIYCIPSIVIQYLLTENKLEWKELFWLPHPWDKVFGFDSAGNLGI